MNPGKIILFEPFDTDFGGHYFEHSSTHVKFLLENGYEPVFVLGGRKTEKLESLLNELKIKYYKIRIPVYKARSKLPAVLKVPLNFIMENLRLIELIKLSQKEKASLISILTFGVYEPLQLFLATSYCNCKIPMIITMHTLTIEENFSLDPKKLANHLLSFFHFIFLRRLLKIDIVKKIVFYSDAARDFYLKYVTEKITRVLHPTNFDYESFTYTKEYSRNLLNLPQNDTLIFLFNPDTKGKYVDTLINSLSLVKSDFKLVIVGYMSKMFESNLKSLIQKNNLSDKIILRNEFVDAKLKYHYINSIDLTLLPYRSAYAKARASSSFFVESIMLKKPVILTTGVIETDMLIKENNLGLITEDTVESWSKTLNYFLDNKEKLINFANNNAPKIRDAFLSKNTLDKVYDKNIFNTNVDFP